MSKKISFLMCLMAFFLVTFSSCQITDEINRIFNNDNTDVNNKNYSNDEIYKDFSIHFLTLGNEDNGDCIYVKAGEQDILIDAGSKQSSSTTIINYVDNYCTDKKLEYVFATHGDFDHISAFNDSSSNEGVLSHYKVDNIIKQKYSTKDTASFKNFIAKTEELKEQGTKVFTSYDCFANLNGGSSSYKLSDQVTMKILYNAYYNEITNNENDFSTVLLFEYKNNNETKNFLLTGDLEKKGEEKMMQYYDGTTPEKTLPKIDVYKAGHHGSSTSSSELLLSTIQPKVVVVSCVAGSSQFTDDKDTQFPTQAFISRVAKYTENVYVTSQIESYEITGIKMESEGFKDMNGNIVVSCAKDKKEMSIYCSNNNTKLKDTTWFNEEITYLGIKQTMRDWN